MGGVDFMSWGEFTQNTIVLNKFLFLDYFGSI